MKRAKIEVVERKGTFVSSTGERLYKFLVNMDDNADGMVFSPRQNPWWQIGEYVWYTITGHNNGMDHFRFSRNGSMRLAATTPGNRPANNTETWKWAIATAASVQLQPMTRPTPQFWADVEADAIRLHMMLDKLTKT